jgi:hypothetical protein
LQFLIGAIFALLVGVATFGSMAGTAVAFGFATIGAYMFLPLLGPSFMDGWLLVTATMVLGGSAALWARRHQDPRFGRARAAVLTIAAAPIVLLVIFLIKFASTWSPEPCSAPAIGSGHRSR